MSAIQKHRFFVLVSVIMILFPVWRVHNVHRQ